MKEQKHKSILLEGNAAIDRGDHEGFLQHCSEDTEWNFIGDQVLKGKQAVREYMKATYLEPPIVKVEHLIAENDFLTVIGEISMKDDKGTLRHYNYCDTWRFEDDLMAELKAFVVEKTEGKE